MKKTVCFFLLMIFFSLSRVMADEWKIDSDHTSFYFDIKHIHATVRGSFHDFSGTIRFDPDDPSSGRFDLTVEVDSIDTGIAKRDAHLRSADFFDAPRYPRMTFYSSRIRHAGDNRYLVDGTLTIKDVSRDTTLEFIYWGQRENPLMEDKIVAGLDSRLTIDRLEYHVGSGKFFKMGAVGKEVHIFVTMELLREK